MSKREVSRRDFIKTGAIGLLGGIALYGGTSVLLRNPAVAAPEAKLDEDDWEKHPCGFVVDTKKCIGCGRCLKACKLENDVSPRPEYNRTWVERYVISEDGKVFVDSPNGGIDGFGAEYQNIKYRNLEIRKSFFVPKLCNQCDNPPCVQVCPVGATYMTEEGIILIDRGHCIGCGYCIQACPYGARFMMPDKKVADKCTWCYHRITKGLVPACVEACPVGARICSNLSDPESPVRKLLREKRVSVLKPDLGTKPKVYYIALEEGVR